MAQILAMAPLFVAPIILFFFSLVSAYVLRFRISRGGLGFDYIVFTVIIVIALRVGGAI